MNDLLICNKSVITHRVIVLFLCLIKTAEQENYNHSNKQVRIEWIPVQSVFLFVILLSGWMSSVCWNKPWDETQILTHIFWHFNTTKLPSFWLKWRKIYLDKHPNREHCVYPEKSDTCLEMRGTGRQRSASLHQAVQVSDLRPQRRASYRQ